jgi:GT2 family glycosyltransferase
MWPRAVFERVGLFDEELVRNQDDELNYRLRKAGGRIFITTRMRSRYQNRQSLRMLWRQFFQYGLWKIRVLQKHPRQMSPRQFVPPLFVLSVITTAVAAPWLRSARWLLVAALGAYAGALLAAASTVARQHGWRHFPRVLAAFATMHLSWGSGFLVGTVRFADRWCAGEPAPPQLPTAQAHTTT